MNDQYIGTIIPWTSPRIPQNCRVCNGQLLPIVGNEALYSILGTMYGGDGRTNFGVPDLRNRTAVGVGTNYPLAYAAGQQYVTLTKEQMPTHTHNTDFIQNTQHESAILPTTKAGTAGTSTNDPTNNYWGKAPDVSLQAVNQYTSTTEETMATDAVQVEIGSNNEAINIANTGGSQQHLNVSPFLTINWLIVIKGFFPQRS